MQRLLGSQIIAGIFLAIVLALPIIIRYAVLGNYTSVVSILLGVVFVVSFAVSSGIVTGGKRFFEIIFFMLTYINVNLAPPFDYFGAFNSGVYYTGLMLAIIFFFCWWLLFYSGGMRYGTSSRFISIFLMPSPGATLLHSYCSPLFFLFLLQWLYGYCRRWYRSVKQSFYFHQNSLAFFLCLFQ